MHRCCGATASLRTRLRIPRRKYVHARATSQRTTALVQTHTCIHYKNIYICIYGSGSLTVVRKYRDFYKMIPKRTTTSFEKFSSKMGSKMGKIRLRDRDFGSGSFGKIPVSCLALAADRGLLTLTQDLTLRHFDGEPSIVLGRRGHELLVDVPVLTRDMALRPKLA